MKDTLICFDVDGTLITPDERRTETIDLLVALSWLKNVRIVVWSGGGKGYAQRWVDRLGIGEYVWLVASKTEAKVLRPDIAVDDVEDCQLGAINLIVGWEDDSAQL